MKNALVLTVIGTDRPGLVEALSETISSCDGNWEHSRMARLGGRFAGMLLITLDPGRTDDLQAALAGLQSRGLHVRVEPAEDAPDHGDWQRCRIQLMGHDHPGIVTQVSRALATRGMSVEELSTSVGSAPMAGHSLFTMTADIVCPPGIQLDQVRADLEALAGDLMVDITLAPASETSS